MKKIDCPAFEFLVKKEKEIKGDKKRNYILTDLEEWAVEEMLKHCIYPKPCGRRKECNKLYDKIAGRMRLPPIMQGQADAQGSGEPDSTGDWMSAGNPAHFKEMPVLRY